MDAKTFDLVGGMLAHQVYHDDRDSVILLLEIGAREGTLADGARVVAGRYALQPQVVVEWFSEVLNRRVQEAQATIERMKELTEDYARS